MSDMDDLGGRILVHYRYRHVKCTLWQITIQ